MLCVVGMNFLVYCVKESFVLVTLRRFDNQRCVRLIEHKTLDKESLKGEGTHTRFLLLHCLCAHTLVHPPREEEGKGYWDPQ